ncbi:hypothetical protein AGMMS50256_27820 [Betaproteobacteria bacterium]|nr:hypothetical protein AGMMS50256_27820 [Betaproteobacteria bacterium]
MAIFRVMPFIFKTSFPVILLALSTSLRADTPELDAICWWKMIGQTAAQDSAQDMGMSATLKLDCPADKNASGKVEVYYRIRPWERVDNVLKYGPPKVFRKFLETNENPSILDFYSGQYENIEVWAKAKINGKTYFSGTVFNNYARGEKDNPHSKSSKTSKVSEAVSSMPQWPILGISRYPNFYYVQTGQSITLESSGFSPETVRVYQDKKSVAVIHNQEGQFQYTPPHDAELSKLKFSDYKDLVFIADLPSNAGQVSFYLPLHRSYRGQTDLKGGLMVLAGSILLALGWVVLKNRSFRWRT